MDKTSSSGILRVTSSSDTRPLADRLEPVPEGIMPVVSVIGKRFYQNIDSIGSFRLHTHVCDDAHVLAMTFMAMQVTMWPCTYPALLSTHSSSSCMPARDLGSCR